MNLTKKSGLLMCLMYHFPMWYLFRNLKRAVAFSFLLLSVNQVFSQAPSGYQLEWADEFNGNKLDTLQWKYRIGASGTSFQRAENVRLADGKMVIDLKKEKFKGKEFTGGGIITKQPRRYGYYEVSVKIDGGYGWHEAFWTTWMSGFGGESTDTSGGKLEIDALEHYTTHDSTYFSYGTIQWSPIKGNANRDFERVKENLTKSYNTFGFEYTPDYLNYFYNGKLLKTIDVRELPHHDFYLWLSTIANQPDATGSGTVFFDYVRYYKITPAGYKIRKVPFLTYIDLPYKQGISKGNDLWIEAEDFLSLNGWSKELEDNVRVIRGQKEKLAVGDSTTLSAFTGIKTDQPGTYRLWVRSRDYGKAKGSRDFKVAVNGKFVATNFGKRGQDGFYWEDGGTVELKGKNSLTIFDSSQFYARCDKILLSSDLQFVPQGNGAPSNVKHISPAAAR